VKPPKSGWREPCGTPAAEVMTRETAKKWLKRAEWDSCSRGDDTWNCRKVVEDGRVGLLQQRWWHVKPPGSGWREPSGTPAAEVMTRETVRKWLKRAVSLLYCFSVLLILYFSLCLTTSAMNICQHTNPHLTTFTNSSTAADCPLGASYPAMDSQPPHSFHTIHVSSYWMRRHKHAQRGLST